MKLSILFLSSLILSSCVSQEHQWSGSLDDFTSSYVDELRKLCVENKQETSFRQNNFLPLIPSLFIDKAEAKTKEKKKRRVRRRKPASQKQKPLVLKTEAVRKIQQSQARRMNKLDKFKVKTNIGEKEDGFVGIRTLDGLSKKDAEEINKLVEAENKDRQNLYSIIVKSSRYDKKMEETLKKSFFDSYQEWAPVGTYFFKDDKWQKK